MLNATFEAKDLISDYKAKLKQFPKAVNSAINQTAAQTKTFISKEIRSKFNIKAADLNKSFYIKRSTWQTLSAEITGVGRGISISRFGAKKSSRPLLFARQAAGRAGGGAKVKSSYKRYVVRARIKPGAAKIIPGTFQGKTTFFKRKGLSRLPIVKVYGPGVAQMFGEKMQQEAINHIEKIFPQLLEKNIEFFYK